MIRKNLLFLFLLLFISSCVPSTKEDAPVTWKQDEDEIVFYVYLSREASVHLVDLMNEPVTFEQVSDFLVENTNEKIPFIEGAMTSAALVARREEMKADMEKKISEEGLTIEIIGFKENPVSIMEGALDFSDAPKYLAGFDAQEYAEIVDRMIDLMSEDGFVVEVYGRFTEQTLSEIR